MTNPNPLQSAIRACEICAADLPLGPRPVVQLDPSASILIAGQAPGRRVHESGVPFDDPSGDRLRSWLGIDKDTFYDPKRIAILPMGFCYPGSTRSGDKPPRRECAQAWRDDALAMLTNVRLTVVLGKYAQDWHLDATTRTVTAAMLAWRDYWPEKVPLPHPSPRNQAWFKKNAWFEQDLLPALRQRVHTLIGSDDAVQ